MKFYTDQVIKITGLSQRKIIEWVEKGLIVPLVDARGAGSRREYSYSNLIEFGIIKILFDIGQSVHMIKSMMRKLRDVDLLRKWTEDYDEFLTTYAKVIFNKYNAGKFNENIFKEIYQDINFDDPKNFADVNAIKKWLTPKRTLFNLLPGIIYKAEAKEARFDAVLMFYLDRDEIVPHFFPYGISKLFALGAPGMDKHCENALIMVDVTTIRRDIEKKISKVMGTPLPEGISVGLGLLG